MLSRSSGKQISSRSEPSGCAPPTHTASMTAAVGLSPVRPASSRDGRYATHLKFVVSRPCLICAQQPSDPHHVRYAQPRAIGIKVNDEFTVPLCRGHIPSYIKSATTRPGERALKSTRYWSPKSFGQKPCAARLILLCRRRKAIGFEKTVRLLLRRRGQRKLCRLPRESNCQPLDLDRHWKDIGKYFCLPFYHGLLVRIPLPASHPDEQRGLDRRCKRQARPLHHD